MGTQENERPGPSLYQGVDKVSTGYKLLEAMGWREGDGLGAQKQGIREHVKVKKKHDALGVGAAEVAHSLRDWTTGMMSYESILSGLKEVSSKHAEQRTSSGSASSTSSSAPPSPQHQRASKRVVNGKSKKQSKRAAAPPSSSSSSSSDEDDSSLTTGNIRNRTQRVSHVGRYARREQAKKVSRYSAADLAAILGESAAGDECVDALPPVVGLVAEHRPSVPQDKEMVEAAEEQKSSFIQDRSPAASEPTAALPPGPRPWWSPMFVRSSQGRGLAHEMRQRPQLAGAEGAKGIIVHGFREEDQEQLYHQAHQGAVQGRTGLGRAGALKKVGGVNWQGTKTQLGSDDEGEAEAMEEQEGVEGDEECEETAVVILAPRQAQVNVAAVAETTNADESHRKKLKREKEKNRENDNVTKSCQDLPKEAKKREKSLGKKDIGMVPVIESTKIQPSNKRTKKNSKKDRGTGDAETCEQVQEVETVVEEKGKVKWKSVCRTVLQQSQKKRMKVSKLTASAAVVLGVQVDDQVAARVLRVLQKSSAFQIDDRYVCLQ